MCRQLGSEAFVRVLGGFLEFGLEVLPVIAVCVGYCARLTLSLGIPSCKKDSWTLILDL